MAKYSFEEEDPESNNALQGRTLQTPRRKRKITKCEIILSIFLGVFIIAVIVFEKIPTNEPGSENENVPPMQQKLVQNNNTEEIGTRREIQIVNNNKTEECVEVKDTTCTERDCVFAASQLLKNMDETIDPCDNFYKFACGGYLKMGNSTVSSHDNPQAFSELKDIVVDQLNYILGKPIEINEILPYKLSKGLYQSCLKPVSGEENKKVINNILKEVGGWPLLEGNNWMENPSMFSWKEALHKFRNYGLSPDQLFKLSLGISEGGNENETIYILKIEPPTFSITRETLVNGLDGPDVKTYILGQNKIISLLAGPDGFSDLSYFDELTELVLFEIDLAQSVPELSSNSSNMSISQLDSNFPTLGLAGYIGRILNETNNNITSDHQVTIVSPEYLRKLDFGLKFTSKRLLANYLLLKVVDEVLEIYITSSSNTKKLLPKWKSCVKAVSKYLPNSVGAMYMREYVKESTVSGVTQMMEDIRQGFLNSLDSNSWIDDLTRSQIKAKILSLKIHVGVIDELTNEGYLVGLYSQMAEFTNESSYLDNVRALSKLKNTQQWSKLGKVVEQSDLWKVTSPVAVNGYHIIGTDEIYFPAGILGGYFYNNNRPSFMNYAALGWIGGHELTHTLEVMRKQYNANILDSNNNALNSTFNQETRNNNNTWQIRKMCFVEQYANYEFDGIEIDSGLKFRLGIDTSEENVADNGGIKAAYNGYQLWSQRNNHNGLDKKLPGLSSYTSNQLFWLSAANVYCEKTNEILTTNRVLTDIHPPSEFRVNGAFANMEKFQEDFKCPLGSHMNPVEKCELW